MTAGEPVTTTTGIGLPIDFNMMDETGLPWAFLDEAAYPSRVVAGAHLVAGSASVRAVVDVTDDGIVHVGDVPARSRTTPISRTPKRKP